MNVHSDRRQFMKLGIAAIGMSKEATAAGQLDSHALKKLRAQTKGSLVLPTDSGYESARRIYFWNPATEKRPALIVRCADADDIRRAVEFANRGGLEVAVRGGGHSLMGWGTSNGL